MSPIILDPITAATDAAVLGPVQRILRGVSATLGYSFTTDGTVIDPGTSTVTVTASDGTVLAGDVGTSETTPGVFTYTLTPAQTAQLDTLTVVWKATIGGQPQQIGELVEIVGGFLFTLSEARAIAPLSDTAAYTTADLLANRTAVEQSLEQECGVAFVPRYTVETVDGSGGTTLMLSKPLIRGVRSVTVSGVALGASDLALVAVNAVGGLYWAAGWPWGASNVTVGYEHGFQAPPSEIRRAGLMLAKMWLVGRRNPIDDRAVTFSATEGGTYSLAVAGRGGSSFGHPDIDVAVQRYSYGAMVA